MAVSVARGERSVPHPLGSSPHRPAMAACGSSTELLATVVCRAEAAAGPGGTCVDADLSKRTFSTTPAGAARRVVTTERSTSVRGVRMGTSRGGTCRRKAGHPGREPLRCQSSLLPLAGATRCEGAVARPRGSAAEDGGHQTDDARGRRNRSGVHRRDRIVGHATSSFRGLSAGHGRLADPKTGSTQLRAHVPWHRTKVSAGDGEFLADGGSSHPALFLHARARGKSAD